MKHFGKYWWSIISLLFALVFFISFTITSYADVNDLLIGTGSNALMTLELDDSDYSVMPMSSIVSVTNTINRSGAVIHLRNDNEVIGQVYMNSSGEFSYIVPAGKTVNRLTLFLYPSNMPYGGTYRNQFDFASHTSLEYNDFRLYARKDYLNASSDVAWYDLIPYSDQLSGDCYLDFIVNIPSGLSYYAYDLWFDAVPSGGAIGGTISVSFSRSSQPANITVSGTSISEDYQNDVSSSLSDLSSSVDTMTDEISGVTEAIQSLQGAMEPHYSNVLTQLHHITEQLHAFYDQVYNNIHLPELDMLTQIRNAIENIDLQIEVDISEVKTAINNMSTAVQNKLQSITDQITGGYDNSGIVQENEKLEQSINDYDEVESEIFDEAGGFVGEFEYPSVDSLSGSVIKALAFVGSFLQSIFLSMGDFSSIITFSLTMIFVMVVVGYHRIRS